MQPSPAPISAIRSRLVVLHEVRRPRMDEPGVVTFLPVLVCVAGVREGETWELTVHEVESRAQHGAAWLSPGERADVEVKLGIQERLRADDARRCA